MFAIIAPMRYFLGIDGGSKTRFILADENRELATALRDASNLIRVGAEQTRTALRQGIVNVCDEAGVRPDQVSSVVAGMAGAGRPEIAEEITAMLRQTLTAVQVEVTGDMVIAYEAALAGEPGVVVVAGTGSIAYGRRHDGATARAGGWGYAISDEGSGYWIGMRAVAAVMKAHDGGQATELEPRIFYRWNLREHDELVRIANGTPPPDFAELFPEVELAFEQGDRAAQEILVAAGSELAKLASGVVYRLWAGETMRVAAMGGVFANSQAVRCAFEVELREHAASALLEFSKAEPVEAALARARRLTSSTL